MEGGPPIFRQDFSCPALLEDRSRLTRTGLSPALARLSRRFRLCRIDHWPGPRSLATTSGVSVDVLSSGYLDVSVPRVRLHTLWIQMWITLRWGCPIRISTDQCLLAAPHGFSQRATSFIASQCQGIHQMPLRRLILCAHAQGQAHARTPQEHSKSPPHAPTPQRLIASGIVAGRTDRSGSCQRHGTPRSHALPSSLVQDPGPRSGPNAMQATPRGGTVTTDRLSLLYADHAAGAGRRTSRGRCHRARRPCLSPSSAWWSLSGSNR